MKQKFLMALLVLLALAAPLLAAEPTPDYIEFQKVLDGKCSKCHARVRIDQAMSEHRNMLEIQERMVRHGAELNTREKQVLGVFFRANDAKETVETPASEDPLAEYRSVVEARCTGCHSLDVVEEAMRQNRKFDGLMQMMIKRGAVLNAKDVKIIQTFWGEPLR